MYLSLLRGDARARPVQHALGDCRVLHRDLMRCFPTLPDEAHPRAAVGLLYRIEPTLTATVRVLAQSLTEPDWSRLPEWCDVEGVKPLDTFYGQIVTGQTLTLRLRANATKCAADRPEGGGHLINVRRAALSKPDEQTAWLERAAARGGFALGTVRVAQRDADGMIRGMVAVPDIRIAPEADVYGGRGEKGLTFGSALFEGRLTVTDAARFRQTLLGGVGRGKAFGFGLLSVAPAR